MIDELKMLTDLIRDLGEDAKYIVILYFCLDFGVYLIGFIFGGYCVARLCRFLSGLCEYCSFEKEAARVWDGTNSLLPSQRREVLSLLQKHRDNHYP